VAKKGDIPAADNSKTMIESPLKKVQKKTELGGGKERDSPEGGKQICTKEEEGKLGALNGGTRDGADETSSGGSRSRPQGRGGSENADRKEKNIGMRRTSRKLTKSTQTQRRGRRAIKKWGIKKQKPCRKRGGGKNGACPTIAHRHKD